MKTKKTKRVTLLQRLQKWESEFGFMHDHLNQRSKEEYKINFENELKLMEYFEGWLGEKYNSLNRTQISYQLKKRGY